MERTIQVIATTFDGTRAALQTAVGLAKGTGSKLELIVPRIIPYAAELDPDAEPTGVFVRRYRDLIEELGGTATIEVFICRSVDGVMTRVRTEHATIIVGGPAGRWLTSPEERFAGRLRRLGCPVVFVASGVNGTQRRTTPVAAML